MISISSNEWRYRYRDQEQNQISYDSDNFYYEEIAVGYRRHSEYFDSEGSYESDGELVDEAYDSTVSSPTLIDLNSPAILIANDFESSFASSRYY